MNDESMSSQEVLSNNLESPQQLRWYLEDSNSQVAISDQMYQTEAQNFA